MLNYLVKTERGHAQVWSTRKGSGRFTSCLAMPSHGRAFFDVEPLSTWKGCVKMLTQSAVLEVKSLLDYGGLSQRTISKQAGVSRGTVGAIAMVRRGLWGREDKNETLDVQTYRRCPECGGLVTMPCVLCALRNAPNMSEISNLEVPSPDEMELAHQAWQCTSRTEVLS